MVERSISKSQGAAPSKAEIAKEFDRVRGLAQELGAAVAALAEQLAEPPAVRFEEPGPVERAALELRLRAMLKARRDRERYFPAGIFADPGWDMLLDLFANEIAGLRTTVSSACIASGVPATTALRFIRTLVDGGVLVRMPDATDGRRVYLELTEKGRRSLVAFFGAHGACELTGL